jgi:predicted glycosyltransferase
MIDVLTPKQALLFGKVKEKLEEKGCRVLVTSRRYVELTNIFKLSRIKPVVIGRHGGGEPYGKLASSLDRMLGLLRLVRKTAPDIVLSFSSPEAARVAFGLGIPHVAVNDSPHSTYVARLTIPLSRRLLTPRVVGKNVWLKYGISGKDIVTYRSLDPVAWLRDFNPAKSILRKYGLVEGEYFVYRPEEYRASYLSVRQLTLETVSKVFRKDKCLAGLKIVIAPRYEKETYRMFFRKQDLVILEHGEDTRSILFYSKGFIGAGGTMSAEAVLMGVPAVSIYPSSTVVEGFLVRKGLLVKPAGEKDLRNWLRKTVSREFEERERLSSLRRLRRMEDPAEKISETCLNLL